MKEIKRYDDAVKAIKTAILRSQYDAARSVNEKQLMLYYGIGKYISMNSRKGFWGKGAIDAISGQLSKELPGLRGFSARNLRHMRTFYEEWSFLAITKETRDKEKLSGCNSPFANGELDIIDKKPIWESQLPNTNGSQVPSILEPAGSKIETQKLISFDLSKLPSWFFSIGFFQHRIILSKVKDVKERLFYIKRSAEEKYNRETLKASIARDDYHHQGNLPNNFAKTLPAAEQALRAISTFKDNYLLDYINVEELGARDIQDVDERLLENAIINNVKNFILTFGKGFAFIRNQYHLEAFGEDQYVDLLFFNRELNCLVAVELKTGKFKTSYLGQLQGYLSILDGFEKKPHENPSIGLILCKDMNRSFVDYVIQDYTRPMGVATYKTSKDMSDKLRKALPDIEDLRKLLDSEEA